VEVVVGLSPRVLLGNVGAEHDMGSDGFPESLVVWEPSLVQRLEIQSDEAIALLVSDLQVSVDVDDVLEAELLCEARGAAECLGGEPGQWSTWVGRPSVKSVFRIGSASTLS
jgi:hypothetical protein